MVADVLCDHREYCYELDEPQVVRFLDENWQRLQFNVQADPLRVRHRRRPINLLEIRIPSALMVEFERSVGSAATEKYRQNPVFKLEF